MNAPAEPFPYRFTHAVPGIYAELYLPKKSIYQGVLYDTLSNGFRFERLKEHLLDEQNRPQIREMFAEYSSLADYTDERVQAMEPFSWGYSMYEVDGVFYSADRDVVMEERSQVIRVMFLPDLDRLREQLALERLSERQVRDVVTEALRDVHLAASPEEDDETSRIRDYLQRWRNDLALFLFGYVIFKLVRHIRDLQATDQADFEQEIWLTSFWNLEVNRIELRERYR